jgi:hypothetical protein
MTVTTDLDWNCSTRFTNTKYERLANRAPHLGPIPQSLVLRIGEPGGTELPMPSSGHGHIEWLPR